MTYKLTVTTLALTAITSTVAATHAKPGCGYRYKPVVQIQERHSRIAIPVCLQ